MALVVAVWQYRKGQFQGSVRENAWSIVWPYLAIIALFLIGNVGRTIFRLEKQAFKQREHALHRALIEARKTSIPQPPAPNLKFRRVYHQQIHLGHALGGRTYNVFLVEVGNDLSDKVGHARSVRLHVSYSEEKSNKPAHIECPAQWVDVGRDPQSIPVGEGRAFVLAVLRPENLHWATATHGGIELKGNFLITVQFLAENGTRLNGAITLRFKWAGTSQAMPECEQI